MLGIYIYKGSDIWLRVESDSMLLKVVDGDPAKGVGGVITTDVM